MAGDQYQLDSNWDVQTTTDWNKINDNQKNMVWKRKTRIAWIYKIIQHDHMIKYRLY
jgi:hypothetical protein